MSNGKLQSKNTPAYILAALALLFMLGGQVLEAAHHHSASDTVSSCVQCHSGTGVALPSNIPSTSIIIAIGIMLVLLSTQATIQPVLAAYLPRGPPSNP